MTITDKKNLILICAVAFFVYLRVLFFNLTGYDDHALIVDSASSLADFNIFKVFSTDVFLRNDGPMYRPVLILSYMIEAQISGTNPFLFHLSNLFLHLAASCLLYLFLIDLGYKKRTSLLSSLFFSTHPLLSQAVAWIPGRNDSMLAIFVLTSFLLLKRFWQGKKSKYLIYHLIFYFLAVYTKESALILPFVYLVYYFVSGFPHKDIRKYYYLAPVWSGVILSWILLRQFALGNNGIPDISFFPADLISNFAALVVYTGKVFFPFNLEVVPTLARSILYPGFISLIILALLLFLSKQRRNSYVLFGLFWFLIFLLPTLINFAGFIRFQLLEHRIYLSMIGLIIILLETDPVKKLMDSRKTARYLFSAIIIIFASLTNLHIGKFDNKFSFWNSAVASDPHNAIAYENLGWAYLLEKQYQRAEEVSMMALSINPQSKIALSNLVSIHLNQYQLEPAEERLIQLLEITPEDTVSLAALAGIYKYTQRAEEAEKVLLKVLQLDNNDRYSLELLYEIYSEKGENIKAAELHTRLLRLENKPLTY